MLGDLVISIKDPKKFVESGGKLPISVLITGDQFSGKTVALKSVAHESALPLVLVNASEEVTKFNCDNGLFPVHFCSFN